jgi:hypothetical protein
MTFNRRENNKEDFEKPPKIVAFDPKAFIGWDKRKGKSKFSKVTFASIFMSMGVPRVMKVSFYI